jgi:hypothetical protein
MLSRLRVATVFAYDARCPSYMTRRLRGTTLRDTRQRVHSPASN